ncbi:MAG: hypothetical protein AAFR29_08005, partial [Pseudomonadota bacterium]
NHRVTIKKGVQARLGKAQTPIGGFGVKMLLVETYEISRAKSTAKIIKKAARFFTGAIINDQ